MQDAQALLILDAAYDLSASSRDAMARIARAAHRALPDGPVAVARFDSHARIDPDAVCFEGADPDYIARFFEWQRRAPLAVRQHARSLSPRAVSLYAGSCTQLASDLEAHARQIFPVYVLANIGDGSGLYIMFGSPSVREWFPAQLDSFQSLAHHLAAAWRIRNALETPAAPDARHESARQTLRAIVLAHERIGTLQRSQATALPGRATLPEGVWSRSTAQHPLWPALLAGRWSLLDTFMAGGTRHVVAGKNPERGGSLRALGPRERDVVELALTGRSGKWIAFELQLSESTVARTLRTALRRLGVTDSADLVGLQNALFEPIGGVPGMELAITQLTPAATSPDLSDAERAVVTGILGGKRIAAIARERGTSPRTVSNQLASVYKKLGVSSRREVIALLT